MDVWHRTSPTERAEISRRYLEHQAAVVKAHLEQRRRLALHHEQGWIATVDHKTQMRRVRTLTMKAAGIHHQRTGEIWHVEKVAEVVYGFARKDGFGPGLADGALRSLVYYVHNRMLRFEDVSRRQRARQARRGKRSGAARRLMTMNRDLQWMARFYAGESQRAIAKSAGKDHRTVGRAIERLEEQGIVQDTPLTRAERKEARRIVQWTPD